MVQSAHAERRSSDAAPAEIASEMAAESTFDVFFAAHHPSMVRALTIVLGDAERGRDAAAEGFTRALAGWTKVRMHENPAGWVYRVGLNWARSRRRKTRREAPESAGRNMEPSTETTVIDPRVRVAIGELSPEHRAVIVARFHLDWSEQQIASALWSRNYGLFVFDWKLNNGPYVRKSKPNRELSEELRSKIENIPDIPVLDVIFSEIELVDGENT